MLRYGVAKKGTDSQLLYPIITLAWMGVLAFVANQGGLDFVSSMFARKPDLSVNDPKRGSHIALPSKDAKGRPISRSLDNTLIVVAGSCGSCSEHAFSPKDLDTKAYGQVVLIYGTSTVDITPEYFNLAPNVRVLSDPKGDLAKTLNAVTVPRFYLLATELRMADISPVEGGVPDFVRRQEG